MPASLWLREHAAEMQEECRSQESRHQVSQVHHLIEIIQLSRVVEREQHEAGYAQNKKVQCTRCASAPKIDEQADGHAQ